MINIAQENETVTSVAGIGLVGGSCANAPNWRQAPEKMPPPAMRRQWPEKNSRIQVSSNSLSRLYLLSRTC